LKKRSKKLLQMGCGLSGYSEPRLVKVFWFFFSKKNRFLSSPDCPAPCRIQEDASRGILYGT
jgi:hypothetical protein